MNHINIFALGGLDENGKNCYVLEFNEKIYIINSGVKIPINAVNGVDTLIPSFDYLEKNKKRIQGIFITDVKNESFSALPWLLMKIPNLTIYTSKFNEILIRDRLAKYNIPNRQHKIIALTKMTKIGPIFVQPLELAGSMPGHIAIDFVTPDGDILFIANFVEGDLGIYGKLDYQQLKKHFTKRKLLALIVDSGRSNYAGRAIDKISLPSSVKDVFLKAKPNERIIVGAYDEEMVAIHQILDLAVQTNRPVITYGKQYGQLFNIIKKAHPEMKWPELVDYRYANKTKNAVILVTGSTERIFSRFLRIANNNDVFLKINKTDTVIMIAPAINGLESMEAVTLDDIARVTPKLVDVTSTEYYRHRPARQDIINLVDTLKPDYVIPIMGLYRYLSDCVRYISTELKYQQDKLILMQNGKIAHFIDGKYAASKAKIKQVGDTIVDGYGVGDISTEVINEREILGRDGVIIVTTRYNATSKKLVGSLHINFIGVIDKDSKKEATELIKSLIIKTMDTEEFEGIRDFHNRLRQVIRKKIFKTFDKEPMVVINMPNVQ